MSLKFYLSPNALTPDPDKLSARVLSNRVLDTNSVIKEMLRRGTTITEADINAVLKVMFEVVTDEVVEGNSVNLPLVNIRPGIIGTFNGAADTFDSARHIRRATTSWGIMLQNKMANAAVEKVNKPLASPVLVSYTDVNSGLSNAVMTPGGIGKIVGENLKFDISNPDEGVFFIDAAGTATKATMIETRTNTRLVFVNPGPMIAGSYVAEVRKAFGTTTLVIRKGVLSKSLIVS